MLIAKKFLRYYANEESKKFHKFSCEVEDILFNYLWPGNVRELQNVIRNIVVLNSGDEVTVEMLPQPLAINDSVDTSVGYSQAMMPAKPMMPSNYQPEDTPSKGKREFMPLWEIEKEAIENAITRCDGNIPKAAALLDISASTIYRKRQAWKDEGKL